MYYGFYLKSHLMNTIIFVEECTSTNDELLRFLPQTHSEILGIFTLNQTKGRGQYGNSWENATDKNIAFSLALDGSAFSSDNLINFCTAVFLRNFIANLTDAETKIKWPNDLILNQKKISGILIEKKKIENKNYYIIGIGLNVLQGNFENLNKAGSIFTQTGKKLNPKEIAEQLFVFLKESFSVSQNFDEILNEFNLHLFKKNEIAVFEKNGIRQNGIIQKMDKNGFLWIDLENEGLQKFFHKEIELLY